MTHRSKFFLATFATGFALMTGASIAATTTGNLNVQLIVTAECKIETGPTAFMDFGSTGLLKDDMTAQAKFDIECTKDADYTIELRNGTTAGGLVSDRKMIAKEDGETIGYTLYQNAGHSDIWGDAGIQRLSAKGTGRNEQHTIHGMINPGQDTPAAGTYTDTVQIAVNY